MNDRLDGDLPASTAGQFPGFLHLPQVQILWAVVVPRPGCTEAALQDHCGNRLPPYKRPARFALLNALPRTVTGRVIKDRLKALLKEASCKTPTRIETSPRAA